jgi:DNA-binding MarR family transcriptional regulator
MKAQGGGAMLPDAFLSDDHAAALARLEDGFRHWTGLDALTSEARVLLSIAQAGALSVKEAISLSGLSYSGFYRVLNRLLARRLVAMEADNSDGRVRRLVLVRASEAERRARNPARPAARSVTALRQARLERKGPLVRGRTKTGV